MESTPATVHFSSRAFFFFFSPFLLFTQYSEEVITECYEFHNVLKKYKCILHRVRATCWRAALPSSASSERPPPPARLPRGSSGHTMLQLPPGPLTAPHTGRRGSAFLGVCVCCLPPVPCSPSCGLPPDPHPNSVLVHLCKAVVQGCSPCKWVS